MTGNAEAYTLGAVDFPLPGYAVATDVAAGPNGWLRSFNSSTSSADYWWFIISVRQLDEVPKAPEGCTMGNATELDGVAPDVGSHPVACGSDLEADVPVYGFITYERNVEIMVEGSPRDPDADPADVLVPLSSIAAHQIAAIDQYSSPEVSSLPTGKAPFDFSAPSAIQVDAGQENPFSFCEPRPASHTDPCAHLSDATNPKGGHYPYHCVLGPGTGFPPFGLSLGKDCLLQGAASKSEVGRSRTIVVCAIDLDADAVCQTVTITIRAPKVSLEAKVLTTECTLVSTTTTGPETYHSTTWKFRLSATGTAEGPEGARLSVTGEGQPLPGRSVSGPSFDHPTGYVTPEFTSTWTADPEPEHNYLYVGRDRGPGDPAVGDWSLSADLTLSVQNRYKAEYQGPWPFEISADVYASGMGMAPQATKTAICSNE